MTTQHLAERDRIERYLNSPPDTPYELEYAYCLLGDVQGKTVLLLGCGSGENLIPLLKRGANVIGLDISPELIELTCQRLQVWSAYDTALPDESLDVVFSMALLHHLDLPRVREEIRKILRPGGLFILKEPIRFSRTMGYLRRLFPASTADISDYEHPMTRNEVSVVSQGFEVVAQRNFRLPSVPVLTRLNVGRKQIRSLDRWLLQDFPGFERITTVKVMCLRK